MGRFSGGNIAASTKPGGWHTTSSGSYVFYDYLTDTFTTYSSQTVYLGTANADQMKADQNQGTFMQGLGGKDVMIGYNGNDFLSGGAGNDDINGGAGNDQLNGGAGSDNLDGGSGNDQLWGDAAKLVTIEIQPGQGQITDLTFDASYDVGDVITIGFQGTDYTYTVGSTDPFSFDPTAFADGSSNLLSDALTAADVTVSDQGSGTWRFTDADADAINGAFTLSATVDNVAATPEVVAFDLGSGSYVADENGEFVLTLHVEGTDHTFTSGWTDGTNTQDAILDQLVTDNAADILSLTGGTLAYDDATDTLTLTGASDGSPLDLDVANSSGQAFTRTESDGTSEVGKITLTNNPGNLTNGSWTVTLADINPITVSFATANNVGDATDDLFAAVNTSAVTSLYTVAEVNTSNTHTVTATRIATGDITNISVNDGTDAQFTLTASTPTQGIDGSFGDPVSSGGAIGADETQDPVQVSDNPDPQPIPIQGAADPVTEDVTQACSLAPDNLTGGTGNDVFFLLTSANGTNMLSDPAGPLYDTIKDLNLSEDKIGLSFIVNNVVDLGTYGGVGSLQDAVQTLFDNSGPLNEVANAAGLFTYGSDTYLVATGDAASSFDTSDVIARVTGYSGSLDYGTNDTSNFVLATNLPFS